MVSPKDPASAASYASRKDHTVLVLQGGGALGAYQAGVFEALSENGFAPDWVTGVSIGAINAALIAGNPPARRVERLREFWERVSSGLPLIAPAPLDPMRRAFNMVAASMVATFGVPGFFHPRVPPALLAPDGTPEALSIYDTAPLRATLLDLVDFDLINAKGTRVSFGASEVDTGNSKYFDNYVDTDALGPEHVMASGALPPGFPPVRIGEHLYWDGGLVSNSPLWYVLDEERALDALVLQVDLFSARGSEPSNLDQVLERAKDIQYSSKTRFNTNRAKEIDELAAALRRLLARLPPRLRDDPDVVRLASASRERRISVVHLINRRFDHSSFAKDYEFSRATMLTLWEAGREAVRRSMQSEEWAKACGGRRGLQTFDLAR